ncbi:uncharacterized protein METZ01_LOCUS425446, partial [marine metagenome]
GRVGRYTLYNVPSLGRLERRKTSSRPRTPSAPSHVWV